MLEAKNTSEEEMLKNDGWVSSDESWIRLDRRSSESGRFRACSEYGTPGGDEIEAFWSGVSQSGLNHFVSLVVGSSEREKMQNGLSSKHELYLHELL